MAGILDLIQSEDPAVQNGLLNFGLSLLRSKGNFGNAVGQAGVAGQLGARDYRQQEALLKRTGLTDQLLQMQVQQAQQQAEQQRKLQELATQYSRSPQQQAMAQNGGPTVAAANAAPNTAPGFDYQGYAGALPAVAGPLAALQFQQMLRKEQPQPIKLGQGEQLLDPNNYKQLAVNNKDQQVDPNKPFMLVNGQIVPNKAFQDYSLLHAKTGAAKTDVNMKVENKLGEGLAKEVGPMVKESYDAASGAQKQIFTSNALIKAVDSGNVISGPGASFRLRAAQIAQTLGVTGRDTAEQIANTRAAIQGLAQSTVAARSALKGQGQVSDFEGRLLERAASGDIDNLTAGEIKQIATVNKRLAQQQISNHGQMVGKLRTRDATAPLADMFDLPPIGAETPQAGGGIPSMSAIDAEIARRRGK